MEGIKDIIAEIAQTPALLKEIYGDIAKPGVQQVGKALNTILGLGNTILWPLVLLNEKARITLEKNLDKYRKKIENTEEQSICEVAPEIGVPIAEKLTYVSNEELSEMYTELLANASKCHKANIAHPSFVNIINNISPDEAIFVRSIQKMSGIPFIEVRLKIHGKNEWITLDPMKPGVSCLGELKYQKNIHAYISNLEGLGLIQIRTDIFMVGENIYEPLEEDAKAIFSEIEKQHDDKSLTFLRGKIEITSFAKMFMNACIENSIA